MPADYITEHTELYFRTHIHTVLPLHAALVELLCRAPRVPDELATVLEDIGQGYCRLADEVNAELIRRHGSAADPDADEIAEARIDAFVQKLVGSLGHIELRDGRVIDARRALEGHPVAADAIKAALWLAKSACPDRGLQPASREVHAASASVPVEKRTSVMPRGRRRARTPRERHPTA